MSLAPLFFVDSDLPFGLSVRVQHALAEGHRQEWISAAPSALRAAHPKRLSEWISARVALAEAFRLQGVTINTQVRFNDHHSIMEFPAWRFSLSHNDDWAIAWVAGTECAPSLGVDLESELRSISAAARKRLRLDADLDLDPLRLWSVKEAAYKTLPKHIQRKSWVGDVRIGEGTFQIQDIRGKWSQKASEGLILSYAHALQM